MNPFKAHLIYILLILLAAWPLFNLNMVNQLDWGDDNCKYMEQAQQLAEGTHKVSSHYVFNPKQFLGPKHYPNGYPLLLAAWSKLGGFSVLSFNYLNTILLALSACCLFLIASRYLSLFSAFALSLVLMYHPAMMAIKMEVVSETAFLFFSLLVILLLFQKKIWFQILAGLLLGFTVHIRVVGFAILIAALFIFLFDLLKKTEHSKKGKNIAFSGFIIGFLAVYSCIVVAFPVKSNYGFFTFDHTVYKTALIHISANFQALFESFISPELKEWQFVGLFTGGGLLFAAVMGWFILVKTSRKNDLVQLYVLIYFAAICFFRFGDAGFRFVVPVFPFLLIYAVVSFKQLLEPFNLSYRPVFTALTTLLLVFSFTRHYPNAGKSYHTIIQGPNETQAQGMFAYINAVCNEKDKIAFCKPRAMSFLTGNKSVMPGRLISTYELNRKVNTFKFNYFVFYDRLTDWRDLKVMMSAKNWKTVYRNGKCAVFKRLD